MPLTRVDALVAAAILDHDPERAPSWDGIAARLRDWASTQPTAATEEGEMPSQSTDTGPKRGTLGGETEAVPEVRKHRGDLTASSRPTKTGDSRL